MVWCFDAEVLYRNVDIGGYDTLICIHVHIYKVTMYDLCVELNHEK